MKKYLFGFIGIFAAVAAFASVPPGTIGGDDVNPRTRLVTNAWENAKGDIMAAMTDGEARPLPRYIHALTFFDAYPAEAAAYYATLAEVGGGCSAVRDGNTLARNFDFPFDDRAEFVITMQPGAGRFASVGVANVGTNLTEAMVNSGKPEHSAKYKWLPGATTDGVNENGVAACINVVSSFGHTNGWHGATVHYLAAVRRVLDTATNAVDAAADLAANVYVPQSALDRGYSFHYIVADRTATYIVEDGEARPYTGRVVMTNYRLFDPGEPYGTGRERAALLANPDADITEAWFTLAYEADTRPIRYSEFVAPGKNPTNEYDKAVASWADGLRETHRGKGFWQSVHTSIYDIENLTLKIAVQEIPDFYTFAIPQGGKVKSVNGMTGDVVIDIPTVPQKWALANVTNAQGQAVKAGDVGALSTTERENVVTAYPFVMSLQDTETSFRVYEYEMSIYDGRYDYAKIRPWGVSVHYNDGTQSRSFNTDWHEFVTADTTVKNLSSDSDMPPSATAVRGWALSKTEASNNYLAKTDAANTYLSKTDAGNTYLSKTDAGTTYATKELVKDATNAVGKVIADKRGIDDFNIYGSDWNFEPLLPLITTLDVSLFEFQVYMEDEYTPYSFEIKFRNKEGGSWIILAESNETYPTPEAIRAATSFTIGGDGQIFYPQFNPWNGKKIYKGGVIDNIASSNWVNRAFVPVTRKVNGQTLTQDITIEGMTTNALIWTGAAMQTKDGTKTIGGADIMTLIDAAVSQKINNAVNANMNTYVDGETGIEYVGKYYGGNLYYVPTGNVYPPNN
mgnify:CR=1 FL=1